MKVNSTRFISTIDEGRNQRETFHMQRLSSLAETAQIYVTEQYNNQLVWTFR